MSIEILDCSKRERDICAKNVIPSQNTAFMFTPGLKDRQSYGTGDKNNKNETSVFGTQIFHWKVSIGKTGLSFQKFHLFREIRAHNLIVGYKH